MAIRPSERISGNSLAFLSAAGAAATDATNTGRPVVLALAAVTSRPYLLHPVRFVTLSFHGQRRSNRRTHPNHLPFNDLT
jgi:hypothetical protein